ncbi:hypothetical protein Nmar_0455 [Nitrosopumilus maritimus SCM1]|uniref:Uncharacterized protein n=2 Tax=Nitrosopumilus maritimus TaxID=338192 RepID=A9A165_NITMS|nr:hypothetical protein Nmar_0455 [Nitrosopumilus maritimus SCM1]
MYFPQMENFYKKISKVGSSPITILVNFRFSQNIMQKRTSYTISAAVLFTVFTTAVIPFDFEKNDFEQKFYGFATIEKIDANGNNVFTQQVHNRLVDTGETFLLEQTFQDSNSASDNTQIGAICVSDEAQTPAESDTASTFDSGNSIAENNCKEDTSVTISSQTAQVGPLTFQAGSTNVANGDTIRSIGICTNRAASDADYNNCATASGILFSVIDTSDVTLNSGETVQITYTFDITSDTT